MTSETNVATNPQASFINDALEVRYKQHPRAPRLIQSETAWKALTLDKVMAAYRHRFGSAAGYTFIFVGTFTKESIEPLLARYLGSLPSAEPAPGWKDLGIRPVKAPFAQTFERGNEPQSLLLFFKEREYEWSLPDAQRVWSLGNILKRVLYDKLRIERSSVYTLNVTSRLEKMPYARYGMELVIPCAPENATSVAATVSAEIERIRAGGLLPEEIQREIESQRRSLGEQERTNSAWLWKLELIYKNEEGFTRLDDPESLIRLLTPENLRSAAERFWRTDGFVQFTLKPKAPATQKP